MSMSVASWKMVHFECNDPILEAPEEFRTIDGNNLPQCGAGGYEEERDRDQENVQDVTGGCAAEVDVGAQRENAAAPDGAWTPGGRVAGVDSTSIGGGGGGGGGVIICASTPGCSRVANAPTDAPWAIRRPSARHLVGSEGDPLRSPDEEPSDLSLELIHTKNELNRLKAQLSQLQLADDGRVHRTLRRPHLNDDEEEDTCCCSSPSSTSSSSSSSSSSAVYDDNRNLVRCAEVSCEFDARRYAAMKEGGGGGGGGGAHLRSLLKQPGRARDAKRRVVFQEERNQFFDADYIILIREECDVDDEEDDDGVCTCSQHEMVRLTCCEPKCNCNSPNGGGAFPTPTPASPKFAPPMEFVDAVTLSPPDGYKDMQLGEQHLFALHQMARARTAAQMATVCRECSRTHEDDDDEEDDDVAMMETNARGEYSDEEDHKEGEAEKTDQSQQTTPTTDDADQRLEEKEQRTDTSSPMIPIQPSGSPISGILKGGRLWKQQLGDSEQIMQTRDPPMELQQPEQKDEVDNGANITSDEESGVRRSVRFIESSNNGANVDQGSGIDAKTDVEQYPKPKTAETTDAQEMLLTFKLGRHIMISNNSLKPNSAVRQLFPCTKQASTASRMEEDRGGQQYMVTSESLRTTFEENKGTCDSDESIRRVIERNTLRRSLIRCEPRGRRSVQKADNSLVERIKQLTCDVDEEESQQQHEEQTRESPAGEEARDATEVVSLKVPGDKSFSPSPSSSSSSASSAFSTYKRITDLFAKKEKPDIQDVTMKQRAPDLCAPSDFIEATHKAQLGLEQHRKQFLATLGPLTACVGATAPGEDYYYQSAGGRVSMASSVGTEYSLEDIEEGLKKEGAQKPTPPDVLAGTPSASESGDELAMFVQQDASRIERIKKKYQADEDEEDEHDDYGFNRRPSVRGIKPRFGTTTEILQQIQQQMQPPAMAWPYYSEAQPSKRNVYQHRPTTHPEEMSKAIANHRTSMSTSPVMRIGGGCTDYYQSLPRNGMRTGRPQSPPPLEVTKGVHQLMYIPYNHIEGYQTYARVSNQNQINKRFAKPRYAISDGPGYSTARATQTCAFFPRYRHPGTGASVVWTDGVYKPSGNPRYARPDNFSDTDSQHSSQHMQQMHLANGSTPNSPTKHKYLERGVPEGAASVSSQDGHLATSPTQTGGKPLFYAMNV